MDSCLKGNLELNLQLFAAGSGEKTEKATPKKKQEARKKGQVLQSREVTTALVLIIVFVTLKISGGYIYSEIKGFTGRIFSEYAAVTGQLTFEYLTKLFIETVTVLLKATVPIFAAALITGLGINYAQVGFLFTTETLTLKLERINPLSGLKRIFSFRSVVELFKAIAKIIIVGYVAYSYLIGEAPAILRMMGMDSMSIAVYISNISINVAIRICVALLLLALLDYGYQWWEYEKNLKMTKQEVKEEFKQAEGNPEVKSKIRQKQRQMSMRRMLHEVPKADVVITNPTHYAIALKYDASQSDAPVVLAKGQDYIALRIKDIARENKVEIVENKALARSIYDSVDIGEKIPPELYQAVAEVIAFVYGLKGKR